MAHKRIGRCSASTVVKECKLDHSEKTTRHPQRGYATQTDGDKSCWWGCGATGTLLRCWREPGLAQLSWKTVWPDLLNWRYAYAMAQQLHFRVYAHRTVCTHVPGVMYKSIYSSIIQNKPHLETTQISINCGMDKRIVVHSCIHGIQHITGTIKSLLDSSARMNLTDLMLIKRSHSKYYIYLKSTYIKLKTRQNWAILFGDTCLGCKTIK